MLPEFDRQTTKWCAGAQSGFFLVIDPGKFCQGTTTYCFLSGGGTSSCLNL